jgi:uncharacterized protein HemX
MSNAEVAEEPEPKDPAAPRLRRPSARRVYRTALITIAAVTVLALGAGVTAFVAQHSSKNTAACASYKHADDEFVGAYLAAKSSTKARANLLVELKRLPARLADASSTASGDVAKQMKLSHTAATTFARDVAANADYTDAQNAYFISRALVANACDADNAPFDLKK